MLEEIHIQNFQSHKNTVLSLHAGINAITGVSDCGKSASLRAINWAAFGKYNQKGFDSFWTGKEGRKVTLIFDGVPVTRFKSSTKNGYRLGDIEFNVIGTNIPTEVAEFINLEPINIQGQHEGYFLLQDTPGEVARKLNKITDLQIIDLVRSACETAIRENKVEIRATEKTITSVEESLKQYEHLKQVEILLTTLLKNQELLTNLEQTISDLELLAREITLTEEEITQLNDWLLVEKSHQNLTLNLDVLTVTQQNYTQLSMYLDQILELQTEITKLDTLVARSTQITGLLQNAEEDIATVQEIRFLATAVETIDSLENGILTASKRAECESGVRAIETMILDYITIVNDLRGLGVTVATIQQCSDEIGKQEQRIQKTTAVTVALIQKNRQCPLCGGKITENTMKCVMEWL